MKSLETFTASSSAVWARLTNLKFLPQTNWPGFRLGQRPSNTQASLVFWPLSELAITVHTWTNKPNQSKRSNLNTLKAESKSKVSTVDPGHDAGCNGSCWGRFKEDRDDLTNECFIFSQTAGMNLMFNYFYLWSFKLNTFMCKKHQTATGQMLMWRHVLVQIRWCQSSEVTETWVTVSSTQTG